MKKETKSLPAVAAGQQPCEEPPRPEQKFAQGQVVVMNNKKQIPFRIIDVIWEDGWFYGWSRRNYASECMLRGLNERDLQGELPRDPAGNN